MTIDLIWKKTLLILLLAIMLRRSLQFVPPVHADTNRINTSNMVLVKVQPGISEKELAILAKQMNGQILRRIVPLSTVLIQLPKNWASTRSGMDALSIARQNANVISVEFDGIVRGIPTEIAQVDFFNSTIPSLPVMVNDVDYNNPQRQVYAPGLIQVQYAWNYTMGSNQIKIAILDTGVLLTHPEFAGRLLPGYDFVNNDTDPTDDFGHGTHVTGIAAAGANNGIGMVGICPECSIIPVKVLDQSNSGTWSSVAAGMVFAVDAGANIISLSLGGGSNSQIVQDAVQYAMEHNVLVIAAAGNNKSDAPFYPAALDDVVAVAATRNDDTSWSLSNYGPFIDVAAPGYAIYSTFNNLSNTYGGYSYKSGTSMAAPHVAGLAGLLLSQNPALTVSQIRSIVQETAVDLGTPGRDDTFGYGRIDAFAALQAGALFLPPTAVTRGYFWNDDNLNGIWQEDEQTTTATVSIQVQDSMETIVAQTTPNSFGQWRIGKLYPGSYQIVAVVSGNTIMTSASTYGIQLKSGQEISELNFGIRESDSSMSSYQVFLPIVQP